MKSRQNFCLHYSVSKLATTPVCESRKIKKLQRLQSKLEREAETPDTGTERHRKCGKEKGWHIRPLPPPSEEDLDDMERNEDDDAEEFEEDDKKNDAGIPVLNGIPIAMFH